MAERAKKATSKRSTKKSTKTSKKKTSTGPRQAAAVASEPTQSASVTASEPRDLEHLFDELLQQRWLHPFRWDWPRWGEVSRALEQPGPSIDVVDREKEVVVRAQLPGVKREDLDVSIAERTLTITGTTRTEQKEERDDYFRREIRSGTFTRTVTLPADVNAAKADARFAEGMLELHLPKVRVAKRQRIAVS
jgi:HSP20 family protein